MRDGRRSELVRYAQLQWLVFVAVVILVTAAFLQSLPDRVPPSLLIPAIAVVWSLVLGVPGCAQPDPGPPELPAGRVCAAGDLPARARPSGDFADGPGGAVRSRAGRRLLDAAAAPCCGSPPPTDGGDVAPAAAAVRWATLALSVAGAAAAVTLFVSPWLFGAGLQAVVRDGAVPRVDFPRWSRCSSVPVVLIVLRRRHTGSALGPHLLVAGTAAVQMAALGGYLLMATGELTYYFWKLGLGSLLAALVVTTHAVVTVRVASAESAGHSGAIRPLVAAVLTLVAAAGLGSRAAAVQGAVRRVGGDPPGVPDGPRDLRRGRGRGHGPGVWRSDRVLGRPLEWTVGDAARRHECRPRLRVVPRPEPLRNADAVSVDDPVYMLARIAGTRPSQSTSRRAP